MAFGFVVEKFALFLKRLSFLLGEAHLSKHPYASNPIQENSSIFGTFLVGLGALIGLLAFIKYKHVEKQIAQGKYQFSILLEIMLTLSVLAVGIFLIIYLLESI